MYRLNENTRRLFRRWRVVHMAKSRAGSDQVRTRPRFFFWRGWVSVFWYSSTPSTLVEAMLPLWKKNHLPLWSEDTRASEVTATILPGTALAMAYRDAGTQRVRCVQQLSYFVDHGKT